MATKTLRTPAGTMVYTDVGNGPPIVFLHGNPTSARLYRHLIGALAPSYRCIAPDLLGFGRSEAPSDGSYRPSAHATRVEALLTQLDCTDLTLVLHDWGGPIGLAYALRHPETIQRLVLLNTWAWPLSHRPLIQLFSGLVGTPLGRLLIEHANAFPRLVMPLTLGRDPCPPWLAAYVQALDSVPRRRACWTLAKSLRDETAWLRTLWSRRSVLCDRPALLCWGLADPAFGSASTLRRWHSLFPNATVRRYPEIGHYVPEELGKDLVSPVASFLRSTSGHRS
jgi:haloalkane dehalogenase